MADKVKFSKNGQWTLEKASASTSNPYTVEHHSSYSHDDGQMHQFNIHHGGKHVATGYVHEPDKGKKEPTHISPEDPSYAHHDNAQSRSALKARSFNYVNPVN